ncbi:MAG: hypothetical protein Q9201_002234 [Fulgogasparrea decipioides]
MAQSGNQRGTDTPDDPFEGQKGPPKRGRGRPPGRKNTTQPQPVLVQSQVSSLQLNDVATRSGKAMSSSSRPGSPEKPPGTPKRGKSINTRFKSNDLVIEYLEICNPPIFLLSIGQIRQQGHQIPEKVTELYELLRRVPRSNIPSILQETYNKEANTPQKSKEAPAEHDYLSPQMDPLDTKRLPYLKDFIDHILEVAEFNELAGTHEKQWGNIVCQMLNAFALWPEGKSIRPINIETTPIAPVDLRPKTHDGGNITGIQGESSKEGSSSVDVGDDRDGSISRMIDWAVALKVSRNEKSRVKRAFSRINSVALHSINQTLGSMSQCPMFLTLELKKINQAKDPRVQLAIWAAAGIKKQQMHKWDSSFPMPGITINGHVWELFIFFEVEGQIMMMGPFELGSTKDVNQAWQLLRKLYLLMKWGTEQYKQWFEENILAWADGMAQEDISLVDGSHD